MVKLSGEILHCVGVRYRLTGTGNFRTILHSLSEEISTELHALVMASSTRLEPVTLANFEEQRISVEGKISVMDETFFITRMVAFVKEDGEGHPVL